MNDLTVTLLQSDLTWQDRAANLARFDAQLDRLTDPTDLIILPEMFTTGFSMDPVALAEPVGGPTYAWMADRAARTGAVVTGSLIVTDHGRYYNRLVWMRPDGTHAAYDKHHLFTPAGEADHYAAGTARLIVELRGWRVCPLICYDLRFPVWSRNSAAAAYDLLVYVASWPDRRAHHWRALLTARAIENQCYVAAVNRVGQDANGHQYRGDCGVIDPGAERPVWLPEGKSGILTEVLAGKALLDYRRKLPFLVDGK